MLSVIGTTFGCYLWSSELHLNVSWECNWIWMLSEIGTTFGCFLRMQLDLNVIWDQNNMWMLSEIWTTFWCFLRMQLDLNVIWDRNYIRMFKWIYLRMQLHLNCIWIQMNECTSKISEQVCIKGNRMELHLIFIWEWYELNISLFDKHAEMMHPRRTQSCEVPRRSNVVR